MASRVFDANNLILPVRLRIMQALDSNILARLSLADVDRHQVLSRRRARPPRRALVYELPRFLRPNLQ